jgi:hypothetical protein
VHRDRGKQPLSTLTTTVEHHKDELSIANCTSVDLPVQCDTNTNLSSNLSLAQLPNVDFALSPDTQMDTPHATIRRIAGLDAPVPQIMPAATLPESIIEVVHQFIQSERRRSFCFLAKHSHRHMSQQDLLVVSQATNEDIITVRSRDHYCLLAAYADHAWYTFDEPMCHHNVRHTVALTFSEGRDFVIDNLKVIFPVSNGSLRTIPAVTWLRETYDWDDDWVMKLSTTQCDEQQKWWDGTSKAFRLLDLPLELREAIYLQAIGPVVVPDIYDGRVILGQGLTYGHAKRPGRNRDYDIEKPNMAIMRVNKQVHAEATLIANRDTFKRFRMVRHPWSLTAVTSPKVTMPTIITAIHNHAPHPAFLRNMQLEMSAAYYFMSIGIYPRSGRPFARQWSHFSIDTLQYFPVLQRLDVSFLSPKHPDAICPWETHNPNAHSCQKIWIDWFFTLGWDTLQRLSSRGRVRFSLSGCVKTSSKVYWERVLNNHCDDDVLHIKAAERRIREEKKELGCVRCVCSMPCSREDAGRLETYMWDEADVRLIDGLSEHIEDEYWCFRD